MAVFAHQHVRRLDVAVHDQVHVRMRHRCEHVKKQADTHFHVQPALVTVAIDMLALNIFQDEIELPGRGYAGVKEFCDGRMRESPKNAALAPESLLTAAAHQRNVEKLDRNPALEAAITALGQPDASHSTVADL
jgi:hypothetical protein